MTNEEGRQLVTDLSLHFECLNCRRKFDLRRFSFNHFSGVGFYRCECGDNFSFDGPLTNYQTDSSKISLEAITADDVLAMYEFVKKPLKLNLSSGRIRSDNLKV